MSYINKSPLGHSLTVGGSTKSKLNNEIFKMKKLGYIEVGDKWFLEQSQVWMVKMTKLKIVTET